MTTVNSKKKKIAFSLSPESNSVYINPLDYLSKVLDQEPTENNKTLLGYKKDLPYERFTDGCYYIHALLFEETEDAHCLVDHAFFFGQEEYIKWVDIKTKQFLNYPNKVYLRSIKHYTGDSHCVDVYNSKQYLKKDVVYLNGKNFNKEKLNSYLHKVGGHYVKT